MLTLHNTTNTLFYQTLRKANFSDPYWTLGAIMTNTLNQTNLTYVSTNNTPAMNFWAGGSSNLVSIANGDDAIRPSSPTGNPIQIGMFQVNVDGTLPESGLDVYYRVSGVAISGVDYTNIVNSNFVGKVTWVHLDTVLKIFCRFSNDPMNTADGTAQKPCFSG